MTRSRVRARSLNLAKFFSGIPYCDRATDGATVRDDPAGTSVSDGACAEGGAWCGAWCRA